MRSRRTSRIRRSPNTDPGTSGYAIASLVLGICSVFGIGSILAIVFGSIARKECDEGFKTPCGMATAGLWLGIIGLVLTLLPAIASIEG
jgi:hypothetical protein